MARRRRLTYDDIRKALPSLTDQELGLIKNACSVLGAGEVEPVQPKKTKRKKEREDERFLLFYDTFTELLRAAVGTKLPDNPDFLPRELHKNIRSGFVIIEDLLNDFSPRARTPTRVKFYRIVVMSVIDYLEMIDVTISTKTLTQQLQNTAAILNKQFPGYWRAGMMGVMLSWSRPDALREREE